MPQRALGWAGWSAVAAPLRASNGDFGCRPASFCAAALPPARPPSARRKPTTHGPRPPPPPTTRCVCRASPRPMPRPGPCLSWCLAGLAGWQRQDGWTGALSRFTGPTNRPPMPILEPCNGRRRSVSSAVTLSAVSRPSPWPTTTTMSCLALSLCSPRRPRRAGLVLPP